MTIFRHKHTVKHEELEEILCARSNSLFSEYEVAPGIFELADGPFESYQRAVKVEIGASDSEVTLTTYLSRPSTW